MITYARACPTNRGPDQPHQHQLPEPVSSEHLTRHAAQRGRQRRPLINRSAPADRLLSFSAGLVILFETRNVLALYTTLLICAARHSGVTSVVAVS
jgi:hypothetical protein